MVILRRQHCDRLLVNCLHFCCRFHNKWFFPVSTTAAPQICSTQYHLNTCLCRPVLRTGTLSTWNLETTWMQAWIWLAKLLSTITYFYCYTTTEDWQCKRLHSSRVSTVTVINASQNYWTTCTLYKHSTTSRRGATRGLYQNGPKNFNA